MSYWDYLVARQQNKTKHSKWENSLSEKTISMPAIKTKIDHENKKYIYVLTCCPSRGGGSAVRSPELKSYSYHLLSGWPSENELTSLDFHFKEKNTHSDHKESMRKHMEGTMCGTGRQSSGRGHHPPLYRHLSWAVPPPGNGHSYEGEALWAAMSLGNVLPPAFSGMVMYHLEIICWELHHWVIFLLCEDHGVPTKLTGHSVRALDVSKRHRNERNRRSWLMTHNKLFYCRFPLVQSYSEMVIQSIMK